MKILLLVNDFSTIYNFRMELIEKLIQNGYIIYLASPNHELMNEIICLGVRHIETKLNRKGKNPFKDVVLYRKYKAIIKKIKPSIVLTYTIKPNIYGGLASKKLKIPYIAN